MFGRWVETSMAVSITASQAACALGADVESCLEAWERGASGLRPLKDLEGEWGDFGSLLAGWIPDRGWLKGRRYGMASNAAVRAARGAVERAGWSEIQRREAWIFAASSRGNLIEWLGHSCTRRPFRKFSASNSMHSEIAAAVSIELGIHGPWQMLANGCSAGLDALGMAALAVSQGMAPRALVVAVDLPLIPELLRDFADTGLLSTNGCNDPYAAASSGFFPGEAAAAVTLERAGASSRDGGGLVVERYAANSDAYDSLATPEDGRALAECLIKVIGDGEMGGELLLCPHGTGTANFSATERAALVRVRECCELNRLSLMPMKPLTGHSLGASGLLDVALMAAAVNRGRIPAAMKGLSAPGQGTDIWSGTDVPVGSGLRVVKAASGMGGHNAAVRMVMGR